MTSNPTPPALEIRDYALSYHSPAGVVRILDDISLSIAPGEVLGLVGESGSAKSSLANAIIRDLPGKVAHESGTICLAGRDLMKMNAAELEQTRGARIAMVFQNAGAALDPTQTLGGHLLEMIVRHGAQADGDALSHALSLLQLVGLPDPEAMMRRYPHEVSGGEKQRVVLALALTCNPELILFDEPTSALDATTAATLLDLLRDLQIKTGVAGLFISHDLGVVADIADRIAVIYGGRIVEEATPSVLFANPRHPYTRALLASLPRPSDVRKGRQLDIASSALAPRSGPPPNCVYSGSCQYFNADICDAAPVRLRQRDDRIIACARPDIGEGSEARSSGNWAPFTHPEGAPVLEGRAIRAYYGRDRLIERMLNRPSRRVRALVDANFTLLRGETLGLVGESGSGKTTLARALAGILPFDGQLLLNGREIKRIDHDYRARVQIIFQNPDNSLNPRHSIGTILSRPLQLYHDGQSTAERNQEIANLLERVRLPAGYAARYPHQLSGGEKQRVAIARALAANPDVIICDEITSGLDAAVQAAIVQLLREIQAQNGTALIFITHDLTVLRHVAHRIAVMYLGEIVEATPVAALDTPPYHPYTEALMSSSLSIDPFSQTRRVRLSGELPRRTASLPGCPFDSRCHRRLDARCGAERPPEREFGADHSIRCHIPPDSLQDIVPVWDFTPNNKPEYNA